MEYIERAYSGSKILIIDDDPEIAKLLTTIFRPHGFIVSDACDGKEGLKRAYEFQPDLIILDVSMPEMDGWDVCTRLREMSDVPILMLTARSAEADLVRGFVLGVNDFMRKPFSKAELEVRIRALVQRKRNHPGKSDINRYKDQVLDIDLASRIAELDNKVLDLSATEFSLLACLVRNMGRTVTHSQLLREVWGQGSAHMSSTLTLYIHHLRKKLENSNHHQYIRTQWGRGYCFVPLNEN